MTASINTIDAKEQFSDLINRVVHNQERIILTRRGKEIAVIIPFADLQLLQGTQDQQDLHEAIDAMKEAKLNGYINLEKLKEELA